jgi:hypothetical protein
LGHSGAVHRISSGGTKRLSPHDERPGIPFRARDLGVHEEVLAAGQVDAHVRSQHPIVGLGRVLQIEVAAFDHPG